MTLGDRLAWIGLVLVAMLCLARAMIEHDPFPWWSSDPFVFAPPITGLTPRWALLLNVGFVLASGITIFGQHLRGRGVSCINAVLLLIGTGVLAYHASSDLERTLDASTIAAVACVLLAASQASSLPGARRILGAVTIGFAIMLVMVGTHEVFVTHPETLAMYEQNRDTFLAARGWSEDSFEAMSYERRLGNPEPVAWFGLTNVFASFVAASGAALLLIGLGLLRSSRLKASLCFVASVISMLGVYLCGSKGGYAVFLIGTVLGLTGFYRPTLLTGRLVLTLCGLILTSLVVRGLIGETLGERSLLFRYQYLIGSMNIWLADPLLGCGPGLFQDQYALLKPPLSPEDVASPHSVLFAWIAMLGIGGAAVCVLFCRSVLRFGAQDSEIHAPDQIGAQERIKLSLLIIVLPTILSLRMQSQVLSASEITPVIFGLIAWGGLAALLVRDDTSERFVRMGMCLGAGVLLMHSMIEVTGTLIVSAPLWALMLGVCVRTNSDLKGTRIGGPVALGSIVLMSITLLVGWGPMNRWERSLHKGAQDAVLIADVHTALNAVEYSTTPQQDYERISRSLSSILGFPVSSSIDQIMQAVNQAEFFARSDAIESLSVALNARPSHTPTRIAISQQMLWIASVQTSVGRPADAALSWDSAIALFDDTPEDAQSLRWLGNIWSGRASSFPESPERAVWLRNAIESYESAIIRTPNEPRLAYLIMMLWVEIDRPEQASDWATRTLELDAQMRLDPIRGLGRAERAYAESLAGS